jgi:hypothetical protein
MSHFDAIGFDKEGIYNDQEGGGGEKGQEKLPHD